MYHFLHFKDSMSIYSDTVSSVSLSHIMEMTGFCDTVCSQLTRFWQQIPNDVTVTKGFCKWATFLSGLRFDLISGY